MVHIVSKIYYLVGVFWLFPLLGPLNVLQIQILWIPNCNISYLFSHSKKAFWGLFHNISRIRHTTFLLNHIVNLGIFSYFAPFWDP